MQKAQTHCFQSNYCVSKVTHEVGFSSTVKTPGLE